MNAVELAEPISSRTVAHLEAVVWSDLPGEHLAAQLAHRKRTWYLIFKCL